MRCLQSLQMLVLAGALGCAACAAQPANARTPTVTLRGHVIDVELALTPAAHAHGLMDRTSLPADHGMLFVFPDAQPRTFWMKNTLIPLDMLFFDSARKLVAIQANAQPCHADPCALFPSDAPARYVLELNAGTAAKLGLHAGDVMSIAGDASGSQ